MQMLCLFFNSIWEKETTHTIVENVQQRNRNMGRLMKFEFNVKYALVPLLQSVNTNTRHALLIENYLKKKYK